MFGNKETKAEKKALKEQEQLNKLIEKYNLEDLSEKDLLIVKRVYQDLVGNGLLKAGMALSMASGAEQAKITYLSALVEQNWIIINLLSRLNNNIEKKDK